MKLIRPRKIAACSLLPLELVHPRQPLSSPMPETALDGLSLAGQKTQAVTQLKGLETNPRLVKLI